MTQPIHRFYRRVAVAAVVLFIFCVGAPTRTFAEEPQDKARAENNALLRQPPKTLRDHVTKRQRLRTERTAKRSKVFGSYVRVAEQKGALFIEPGNVLHPLVCDPDPGKVK